MNLVSENGQAVLAQKEFITGKERNSSLIVNESILTYLLVTKV